MRRIRSRGVLLVTAALAACGLDVAEGGRHELPEPVVRDSAGARIVENGEAPPDGWRVGAAALFTLGWGPGDPLFTWIQSGRILADGGALVSDFAAGAVYRVGPDGSVTGSWGRKGEGPGEYQALDAMVVNGDSIIVSDGRLRRVTVLSWEGEVLATSALAGNFHHQVSAILNDGRLLFAPGEGYSVVADTRPEWVFETQPILAGRLQGAAADTLAELPHLRRWYGTRGASPGPVSVRGRAGGFAEGFAWARADEPEVRWYDGSGRLVQVARWDEEPMPLTPESRRRMTQNLEDAFRSQGADESFVQARLGELEDGLDRHEGPLPYWDSFHVDRQGNAWMRQYALPEEPSERWRVITREGVFMGWVDLPEVIAVLDITEDRVLAVRLDALDVPAVVMLELVKT